MFDDFRLAYRALVKARGFTVVAVATLALGIGANAVVFSMVNALVLKPLPFGERTDRLVSLHSTHPTQFPEDWDDARVSFADLEDIRDESQSFERVEGCLRLSVTLYAEEAEAERVSSAAITPGLFPLLGMTPALGRNFREDEGAPLGFQSVVLLSDALWKNRYGADPEIIGKTIAMNERELEVIGVMPERFQFPESEELWLPYAPGQDRADLNRASRTFLAVARLRDDVEVASARAEMETVAERLAERYPETNRGWGLHVLPFRDYVVNPRSQTVVNALLGAVGLVLLIACANLASVLLARGSNRQRELAVRSAIGGSRTRLMRQLLAESLLIGIAGGLLGCLLAVWGLDAMVASFPEELPFWLILSIDWHVVLFIASLSLATSITFGLVPAWRATRFDLIPALGSGRDAASSRGALKWQNALVVGQVATSLALIVGASLMFQSFLQQYDADAGFDGDKILSFRVILPGDAYDPNAAKIAFFTETTDRLRRLPGVASAVATSSVPIDDGGIAARIVTPDHPVVDGTETGVHLIGTTTGFFETLQLKLLEGRPFEDRDMEEDGAPVVIVNERLASRIWPKGAWSDREIGLVTGNSNEITWARVIAVAPNIQYEEFGEETAQSQLNVWVPYGQMPFRGMAYLVRAEETGDPASLTPTVRASLKAYAPGVPAFLFQTMNQVRYITTWQQRFFGKTFVLFAASALLLACLGAYGLVAYRAGTRRREIGVRIALGAGKREVLALLMRQGATLAAAGVALGLIAAMVITRALDSVLYHVNSTEPWRFVTAAALLALSIFAASYIPARRAARTDPMTALRQD